MRLDQVLGIIRRALESFQRPEYTGPRRCWPCTLLNTMLLGVAVCLFGLLGWFWTALIVGCSGLAGIRYRGYLVPYTPTIAPKLVSIVDQHLSGHLAELFSIGYGNSPARAESPGSIDVSDSTEDHPSGEEILSELLTQGILIDNGGELRLNAALQDDWREQMMTFRKMSPEELAEAAVNESPAAETASAERIREEWWIVLSDETNTPAAQEWLSLPVMIADIAATRMLRGRVDTQYCMSAPPLLRMFLERCPACQEPLVEDSLIACCGGPGPTGGDRALRCMACDESLFIYPDS